MAESKQTPQKELDGLAKLVDEYLLAIGPFFDLADEEFKRQSSSDLDGMEFLVRSLRAKHLEFARRAWAIYGDDEEANR